MPLTDRACREAKPKEKDYKLSDEKGLYLLVNRNGSRYWRHKFRFGGKEKLLAYGVYPEVSLKQARAKCLDTRRQISEGIDPAIARKTQKLARRNSQANSFEVLAREWFAKEEGAWSPAHIKKQKALLENNLIPYLGNYPVSEITPLILLDCLRKIESRGALETTRRVKQITGQIMRYGVVTGRAERDITSDLKGALKTPQVKHYASITDPPALAKLLLAIDQFEGSIIVGTALKLLPHVFVRPGELRHMEWAEISFDRKEWNIPGRKMKMGIDHIVPLSKQSIVLLQHIQPFTFQSEYVFHSERSKLRPMSENTINAGLRRLGFTKDEVTGHGFRATARTLLDEELGYEPHLIEHQLAHEVRDAMGRAYNRTKHLPQRKKMMQDWSDYLKNLIHKEF